MSVVIVNTLLTSVMGKLAKFERHVSLSDFTSTVTAKLALAQFLNTALIVIIVNAGYTGGGLGFLQVCLLCNCLVSVVYVPGRTCCDDILCQKWDADDVILAARQKKRQERLATPKRRY